MAKPESNANLAAIVIILVAIILLGGLTFVKNNGLLEELEGKILKNEPFKSIAQTATWNYTGTYRGLITNAEPHEPEPVVLILNDKNGKLTGTDHRQSGATASGSGKSSNQKFYFVTTYQLGDKNYQYIFKGLGKKDKATKKISEITGQLTISDLSSSANSDPLVLDFSLNSISAKAKNQLFSSGNFKVEDTPPPPTANLPGTCPLGLHYVE